jgi:hypothetical protein
VDTPKLSAESNVAEFTLVYDDIGFADKFSFRWNKEKSEPEVLMILNYNIPFASDKYDWTTDTSLNEDFYDGDDVAVDEKAEIDKMMGSASWGELVRMAEALESSSSSWEIIYMRYKQLE